MEVELTSAEKSRIKDNVDGLEAEMKKMDDAAVKALAQRIDVPIEKYPERKDLEAAILLKAEADATAGVRRIRAMDEEEAAMIATSDDKRTEASRVVRRLHAEFTRDIPQEGRSGSYEPTEDDPRFGGDHPVPDGKYRPAGSDHIYEFKKKRLVGVTRATAGNDYGGKGVKSVE